MTGFAIIDLETTGFAYNANDRVCEIGVSRGLGTRLLRHCVHGRHHDRPVQRTY
jgi:hypothetical protein